MNNKLPGGPAVDERNNFALKCVNKDGENHYPGFSYRDSETDESRYYELGEDELLVFVQRFKYPGKDPFISDKSNKLTPFAVWKKGK